MGNPGEPPTLPLTLRGRDERRVGNSRHFQRFRCVSRRANRLSGKRSLPVKADSVRKSGLSTGKRTSSKTDGKADTPGSACRSASYLPLQGRRGVGRRGIGEQMGQFSKALDTNDQDGARTYAFCAPALSCKWTSGRDVPDITHDNLPSARLSLALEDVESSERPRTLSTGWWSAQPRTWCA